MQVHVVDGPGIHARFLHREVDGAGRLFAAFGQTHAMEGLARGAIAGDLGIDPRAAGQGVFALFQDEHPRPFGDDEAIAVRREGPGGALRRMVPRCRHDAHQREALHDAGGDRGVDAAGEHHRQHAKLDLAEGITDRVGGRRAAGRHHVAHAPQPEVHAHLARERAHRPAGDAEEAHLFDVPRIPEPVLLFAELLRAAAGAQYDADLALLLQAHTFCLDAGVAERFIGGCDRQRHRARDVFALVLLHPA